MVKVYIKREIEVEVGLKMTYKGCPAHMGDMNYPGHPAEPPEYDVISVEATDGSTLTEYERDQAVDAALEKAANEDQPR